MYYYILQGTEPIMCPDLERWGRWFSTADRHVAQTILTEGIEISTVFLGLDHSYGIGPPLLFETMGFWLHGPLDEAMARYTTWEEANHGHEAMVARVRSARMTAKACRNTE